jgi:hypothetical protein
MEDYKLIGEADNDQIAQWKSEIAKKYGDSAALLKYTVDDKVCYLRTVDRATYDAAIAKVSTSPAKFTETIIANCWMGGCEDIRTVDTYAFGLNDFIDELINKKKGSIQKL